MPSITPSTFEVNEGDSLSTSLSGFTPNTTLFFKVSGRGINKKDFAAGGVKGSVKVDANGVATISHTLRADKATEGEESFAIQIFSDKRMRNLLGQSDTVTVFDTSVKAVQTPKAGGGKGGNQIPGGIPETSDPITGFRIQYIDRPAIFSDNVYDKNSPQAQGIVGASFIDVEFELSPSLQIATNRSRGADGSIIISRNAFSGSFKFTNGALESARIDSFARYAIETVAGKLYETVEISIYPTPRILEKVTTDEDYNKVVSNADVPDILDRTRIDGVVSTGGVGRFEDIFSFGGGGIFTPNWWQNPYVPNLV